MAIRKAIRKVIEALRGNSSWAGKGATADEADIAYCYRLILGRKPDEEGFNYFKKVIEKGLPVSELVYSLMTSKEFKDSSLFHNITRGITSLGKKDLVLVDCGDFKIYTSKFDTAVGHIIREEKTFEPFIGETLRRLLKPGMTLLDVGANIGYFTLLGARLTGDEGRVISIEANVENYKLLMLSRMVNNFNNIEAYPLAVMDHAGAIHYYHSTGSDGVAFRLDTSKDDFFENAVVVPAVTIDSLIPENVKIDVIKIDIEGGEIFALKGAERLIKRDRPRIISEFSIGMPKRHYGIEARQFLEYMQGLGYGFSMIEREPYRIRNP
jgi:FkbM family methyltransferase